MNPTWEESKLVKDRADILALIEPNPRGSWNLAFLTHQFQRLPFLQSVLEQTPHDDDARERYRNIPHEQAQKRLTLLLEQLQ